MNTERCRSCGRELIEEEAPTHKCKLQLGAVTQIVDMTYQWWTSANLPKYGGVVVIVKASDGRLYRITPAVKRPFKSPDYEDGI